MNDNEVKRMRFSALIGRCRMRGDMLGELHLLRFFHATLWREVMGRRPGSHN